MALNVREKMLVGGLALAGALVAVYTFVHEPLTTRRAEARDHVDRVESELVQEQKKLTREGNLEERRAKVTAREQLIDSWVPGRNSAALLIWHLSQAERLSGARIKAITVGQKELVNVDGKQEIQLGKQVGPAAGQGQPAPNASPGQPAPKAAPGQPAGQAAPAPADQGETPEQAAEPAQQQPAEKAPAQQAQGSSEPANTMTTLVMIPLELKVDATFVEHLIFNQYLEDAPLFLNTWGIGLTRRGELPLEKVGKLVKSGSPWLAEQMLTANPPVDGVYQMALFFKANKAGPSTEEMQFDSPPGRIDPFVMAAVDEFIRMLQSYFADQARTTPPADGTVPSLPGYGQLG